MAEVSFRTGDTKRNKSRRGEVKKSRKTEGEKIVGSNQCSVFSHQYSEGEKIVDSRQ